MKEEGGGGRKGEVCPGPPICEHQKTICDTIITHFVFCPGSQLLLLSCRLPILVILIIMFTVYSACVLSWSLEVAWYVYTERSHAVQSSAVAWFDHHTCGCHVDILLDINYRCNCFAVKHHFGGNHISSLVWVWTGHFCRGTIAASLLRVSLSHYDYLNW